MTNPSSDAEAELSSSTTTLPVVLARQWIEQLAKYDIIYIGFSGGLDSTVLLHALQQEPSLQHKTFAVHINHGLSSYANAWQQHCQQFCETCAIPYQTIAVNCTQLINIEDNARKARYQALAQLVQKNQCLLTAHHQDDQAETLLLHLFRGTGIRGLGGIRSSSRFSQGHLHRPLLNLSRIQLLHYAQVHKLIWIEDDSNNNVSFARNFIRKEILPYIQTKWPAVSSNLARTTKLCRQAQMNLDDLALLDCPSLHSEATTLPLASLFSLNSARQANVLRYWLFLNQIQAPNYDTFNRLLDEMMLAKKDANPEVRWGNTVIKRFRDKLILVETKRMALVPATKPLKWTVFPDALVIPGVGILTATKTTSGITLLASDDIEIKFRRGGETLFWHGQTKSLKKLMQQWQISPWLRDHIPLMYVNQQLAAVVGYAISDLFYQTEAVENCFNIQVN